MVYSITDSDHQYLGDEIDRQEDNSNASLHSRIILFGGDTELDSSLMRDSDIPGRLASLSLTPSGRPVPTSSGDLAPKPE
ncbi:MAG: hypothetical protein ACKPKO_07285, partial [Candidatus Fonsibacter sp.]